MIDRLCYEHRFWTDIPKLPWADDLVALCEGLVGPQNVYILSSPGLFDAACSGKFRWLSVRFGNVHGAKLHERMILTRHKGLMSGPAILVDDKEKTIQRITDRGLDEDRLDYFLSCFLLLGILLRSIGKTHLHILHPGLPEP